MRPTGLERWHAGQRQGPVSDGDLFPGIGRLPDASTLPNATTRPGRQPCCPHALAALVCWQPEARRLTFWKRERRPGMEVAAVGRGLAPPPLASGRRSSSSRASLVTGSRPVSCRSNDAQQCGCAEDGQGREAGQEDAAALGPAGVAAGAGLASRRGRCAPAQRTLMTLRMRRFSYRCPDFLDTTGSSGTVPETAGAAARLESKGEAAGAGGCWHTSLRHCPGEPACRGGPAGGESPAIRPAGACNSLEHSIVPLLSFCSALSSLMFGFHWFTGTERMRAFSCSRLSVGRW
jgi:hypothetical protein